MARESDKQNPYESPEAQTTDRFREWIAARKDRRIGAGRRIWMVIVILIGMALLALVCLTLFVWWAFSSMDSGGWR